MGKPNVIRITKDSIPKKLWRDWEETRMKLLRERKDLSRIRIRKED